MKPQILRVLLVCMLSISITSCSNNKSNLNLNIPTDTSSNKIETSVPPSPSFVPTKNESVLEAYKAVIQNKVDFISTDDNKKEKLSDFLTNEEIYGTIFKIMRFTLLDMDGDEIPDVVLELTPGENPNPEFYEVLHNVSGSVYGYIQVNRGFNNLKTDGSFSFSGSASYYGYGKLRFESDASETDKLGYHNRNKDGAETYFINDKSVAKESYDSFSEEQNRKTDAIWHDFSQKNIEIVLSKKQK